LLSNSIHSEVTGLVDLQFQKLCALIETKPRTSTPSRTSQKDTTTIAKRDNRIDQQPCKIKAANEPANRGLRKRDDEPSRNLKRQHVGPSAEKGQQERKRTEARMEKSLSKEKEVGDEEGSERFIPKQQQKKIQDSQEQSKESNKAPSRRQLSLAGLLGEERMHETHSLKSVILGKGGLQECKVVPSIVREKEAVDNDKAIEGVNERSMPPRSKGAAAKGVKEVPKLRQLSVDELDLSLFKKAELVAEKVLPRIVKERETQERGTSNVEGEKTTGRVTLKKRDVEPTPKEDRVMGRKRKLIEPKGASARRVEEQKVRPGIVKETEWTPPQEREPEPARGGKKRKLSSDDEGQISLLPMQDADSLTSEKEGPFVRSLRKAPLKLHSSFLPGEDEREANEDPIRIPKEVEDVASTTTRPPAPTATTTAGVRRKPSTQGPRIVYEKPKGGIIPMQKKGGGRTRENAANGDIVIEEITLNGVLVPIEKTESQKSYRSRDKKRAKQQWKDEYSEEEEEQERKIRKKKASHDSNSSTYKLKNKKPTTRSDGPPPKLLAVRCGGVTKAYQFYDSKFSTKVILFRRRKESAERTANRGWMRRYPFFKKT